MLELDTIQHGTWHVNQRAVERWLEERQQLLIRFCGICQVRPSSELAGRYRADFQRFCQLLIDYSSCGHFDIYQRLLQWASRLHNRDGIQAFLKQHYGVISTSTEYIVRFNDNCSECSELRGLTRALSRLGEALEARFEAEDAMLELLHYGATETLQASMPHRQRL